MDDETKLGSGPPVISPELDTLITDAVHEEIERYKATRRKYQREYMRAYRKRKRLEREAAK